MYIITIFVPKPRPIYRGQAELKLGTFNIGYL